MKTSSLEMKLPKEISKEMIEYSPDLIKAQAQVALRNADVLKTRVCFLDIETSGLTADFGYTFSYAIKILGEDEILGRVLLPSEIKQCLKLPSEADPEFDKVLLKELCSDLKKVDRIVTHFGSNFLFDTPFLRTRCIKYGLDFPTERSKFMEDFWRFCKKNLKLRNNRLQTVCEFYKIPTKEHKLTPEIWQKALAGHNKCLDYIWTHNKEDVVSLEKAWVLVYPYMTHAKQGI